MRHTHKSLLADWERDTHTHTQRQAKTRKRKILILCFSLSVLNMCTTEENSGCLTRVTLQKLQEQHSPLLPACLPNWDVLGRGGCLPRWNVQGRGRLLNRQFPEITGEDNLTVFSYSGRVKFPEWRWQQRRADLRHFELFRHDLL